MIDFVIIIQFHMRIVQRKEPASPLCMDGFYRYCHYDGQELIMVAFTECHPRGYSRIIPMS